MALVKFEFLNILRKKSTLFVMAVSLLITAVFFGRSCSFRFTIKTEFCGDLKNCIRKRQYAEISVTLTNEYIGTNQEVQTFC